MGSGRLGNIGLNVGLTVFGLLALVMVYAFASRLVTGGQETGVHGATGAHGDIIQVDVRNGCGVSGLAAEMTHFLRDRGFDVIEAGDHDSFDVEKTVLLDRAGNPAAARAVARSIGLPEDRIREEVRTDYFLDVSLIIGADYEEIRPFRDR